MSEDSRVAVEFKVSGSTNWIQGRLMSDLYISRWVDHRSAIMLGGQTCSTLKSVFEYLEAT